MPLKPYTAETGSIAVYARVWRSATFPVGHLYWDDFREVQQPINQREAQALRDERWRPWSMIVGQE